jgi:hypothetical protein
MFRKYSKKDTAQDRLGALAPLYTEREVSSNKETSSWQNLQQGNGGRRISPKRVILSVELSYMTIEVRQLHQNLKKKKQSHTLTHVQYGVSISNNINRTG